jgi:hypothetical protein
MLGSVMIQTKPLTGQCPHGGATAEQLAYHSRYALKNGQRSLPIGLRDGSVSPDTFNVMNIMIRIVIAFSNGLAAHRYIHLFR